VPLGRQRVPKSPRQKVEHPAAPYTGDVPVKEVFDQACGSGAFLKTLGNPPFKAARKRAKK